MSGINGLLSRPLKNGETPSAQKRAHDSPCFSCVMAGLVPAIHVDARVKHGHDELEEKIRHLNEPSH
jgi:hypothetical protein